MNKKKLKKFKHEKFFFFYKKIDGNSDTLYMRPLN